MPKVKKTSSAIHPNSRKALQLARQIFHTEKLEKRKEESTSKQKVKLMKLKWFKENVDVTKEMYTPAEAKELIEKYLNRFAEDEVKERENKSLKRHLSSHTFIGFKTNFLVDREKGEFNTCGLEIPDIMKKKNYDLFKSWNGDAQLLAALITVKVSKRQLETSEANSKGPPT